MKNLHRLVGISAICEALIYICAFAFFGAYWAYPYSGTAAEKMAYLAEHHVAVSSVFFLMYVVFGLLLAVLVVGLHEKLKKNQTALMSICTLLGAVWVVLVIASGMISSVGLGHAVDLIETSPEKALDLWTTLSVVTDSLGGGNELVGGLWVLLVSIAALGAEQLSRALNYLGLFVGMVGIATIYPHDALTEIFGVTQIVWFFWLGLSLIRNSE